MWPDPRMKETIRSLWRTVFPEAPADNKTYGRKNKAWSEVSGGGSATSGLGMDFTSGAAVDLGVPSTIDSTTENTLTEHSHTHKLGDIGIANIVDGTPVEYGALYNWYAATDSRKITSSEDWVVPTFVNYTDLINPLGGIWVAGTHLKEIGNIYWDSSNIDADNSTGFNGRGTGIREVSNGNFIQINTSTRIWFIPEYPNIYGEFLLTTNDTYAFCGSSTMEEYQKFGNTIRLIYTGSSSPTSYTGNDGKVYPVVKIGDQYWLAANLNETKFRNGDWLHGYENGIYTPITNENWVALTTEGMCYYDDNEANGGGQVPLTSTLQQLQSKSHNPVTIAEASASLASIDENQVLTIEPQSGGDNYVDSADLDTNAKLTLGRTGTLADLDVQFGKVAKTNSYNDLGDKPALAVVATSGSYNDLNNKPAADIDIKVAFNFITTAELYFEYNCPQAMVFTSQEFEFLIATIAPPLNTNLAKYDKVTISAQRTGLIILNGHTL